MMEQNETEKELTAVEDAEEVEMSPQKAVLKKIWDATGYLIVPAVIVFLLLGVFFSMAWVPSSSMEPTLPTKSHFFGLRLPYLVGDPMPDRGDIVMFRSDELNELMVKRVIGLPGDVIALQDGAVYLNGEKLEEPYLQPDVQTWPTAGTALFEVPEGCFFAMGDNRGNSLDSRAWGNPYISMDKIRSRALVDIAVLPQCTWRGVRSVNWPQA